MTTPRRVPAVLLLILLLPAAVRAATLEEAATLYEESRYEEAAEIYKELLREQPREPVLHYNLGNAYYRMEGGENLGKAVASYLRAYAIAPRSADTRHNLKMALQRAGEEWVPSGTPPALFLLFHILSRSEIAALHWTFLWLACLLASAMLLSAPLRDRLRGPLLAASAGWLLFGSWWGLRSTTALERPAVIAVREAEVRSGPGLNFPVSFKTPAGRRVSQLDSRGIWVEIGLPKEGLKGWVRKSSLDAV